MATNDSKASGTFSSLSSLDFKPVIIPGDTASVGAMDGRKAAAASAYYALLFFCISQTVGHVFGKDAAGDHVEKLSFEGMGGAADFNGLADVEFGFIAQELLRIIGHVHLLSLANQREAGRAGNFDAVLHQFAKIFFSPVRNLQAVPVRVSRDEYFRKSNEFGSFVRGLFNHLAGFIHRGIVVEKYRCGLNVGGLESRKCVSHGPLLKCKVKN